MQMTTSPALDLTSCDREPIHILGAVQAFGFLLTVSPDWIVTRASANAPDWLELCRILGDGGGQAAR
jgi:light-regulated signal transduction histidine kinase (bacteriophytochrome)